MVMAAARHHRVVAEAVLLWSSLLSRIDAVRSALLLEVITATADIYSKVC